jgi:hypothetical protein
LRLYINPYLIIISPPVQYVIKHNIKTNYHPSSYTLLYAPCSRLPAPCSRLPAS